jgi:hypothetical protein
MKTQYQRKSLRQSFQNFVKSEIEEDEYSVRYLLATETEVGKEPEEVLVEEEELKLLFQELGWKTLTVAEVVK